RAARRRPGPPRAATSKASANTPSGASSSTQPMMTSSASATPLKNSPIGTERPALRRAERRRARSRAILPRSACSGRLGRVDRDHHVDLAGDGIGALELPLADAEDRAIEAGATSHRRGIALDHELERDADRPGDVADLEIAVHAIAIAAEAGETPADEHRLRKQFRR